MNLEKWGLGGTSLENIAVHIQLSIILEKIVYYSGKWFNLGFSLRGSVRRVVADPLFCMPSLGLGKGSVT